MNARPFEKPRAVARRDRHLEGAPIAINQQRHIDAGGAERPDLAEGGRKLAHLPARDGENNIAGADVGFLRRPAAGETYDHDLVLDLSGVKAEPRARRTVWPAELHQVIEDWLQIVDRDDHVEMLAFVLLGRALELQRADAEQVAGGPDQCGAAPIRVRGCSEDRLVEHVLPVAGEFLFADHTRRDRLLPPARAADDNLLLE